jgi:hypothetical protein
MIVLNLDFLENQHLIGRLKLIEILERQSPYRDLPDRVEKRFSQAIKFIPSEFQEAVLALFASTLYIPKQILDDAWRYLWSSLGKENRTVPSNEDLLFLEVDRDLLRDEFFRANSLAGRLQDNSPWRSTHDLVDSLMNIEGGQIPSEIRRDFLDLLRRPLWVLLIDLSVSGTSALSEVQRLSLVASLLSPRPKITVLVQLATDEALSSICSAVPSCHCAIRIPSTCALNSREYTLIKDNELVEKMREACVWFADHYVLATNYRLARLSRESSDKSIAVFGFASRGWSIVTYKNTPNNSLPLLWFRPPKDGYLPPFERIDSRIGQAWKGRREWLSKLMNDDSRKSKLVSLLTCH